MEGEFFFFVGFLFLNIIEIVFKIKKKFSILYWTFILLHNNVQDTCI